MWCRWMILCLLARGTQAFTSAPIRWNAASGTNYVVAPGGPLELPASLSILDASGAQTADKIPFFTAKSDNTIRWESQQGPLCIEATGEKSGAAVSVNRCNGGPAQLWSFMPWSRGEGSHVQLKGTALCIDVNIQGDLNGAPIELRECGDKVTESWKFGSSFVPTAEQTFSLRHVMTYFTLLAAVGVLSLGAWIWRWQPNARTMAPTPGSMLLRDVESGLALTAPAEDRPASRSGDISMIVPKPVAAASVAAAAVWGWRKLRGSKEQNFLEFEPYYDQKTMPMNTAKPKAPFTGKVRSVEKIVGPNATGETYDIIIDHEGKLPYIEGQSFGVIAPGIDPKTGKPAKVRLYSIAASRYGDDMTGKSTTLCVRRATYWCPELNAEDPAKKGVCSNFLCDAKPGDLVQMTGPTGKALLLPENNPATDIIMVATGTGIAPFRSFLKRMFVEKTPYGKDFKGVAWLFLGVANTDSLLYDEDWKKIQQENPDRFRYDVALSREQKNKDGGKMYIQDKVEEYADEIFDRLDKGAHMYFCGLRGMMPGIQDMLKKVAERKGLDIDEFTAGLKKKGQWHVEVY